MEEGIMPTHESDEDIVARSYQDQIEKELAELALYKEELSNEFKDADPDDKATASKASKRVVELVPDAATQIRYLLVHAESEAIRKDLAKFVLGVAMKSAEANADDDQMQKLIKSLTKASN